MAATNNALCWASASPGLTLQQRTSQQCKFSSTLDKRELCFYVSLAEKAEKIFQVCDFTPNALRQVQTRFETYWKTIGVRLSQRRGTVPRGKTSHSTSIKRAMDSESFTILLPALVPRLTFRDVSKLKLFTTVLQGTGHLRPHSGAWFLRQWLRCLYFVITALVMYAFVYQPTRGDATHESNAIYSSETGVGISMTKKGEVLFVGPLHGDAVAFVAARVKAALDSGTLPSQTPAVAAEAAHELSWGECSRLCNGGIQKADRDGARSLAMEGIRRALSGRPESSDIYLQEAGDLAAQLGLDGGKAKGKVKTRPCNTFKCPPEVPTDLKATMLQVAQDPLFVKSVGVIPQIEFSQACKDQLKLDQVDQDNWTLRRKQHLERLREQQSKGEEQGWETTVLEPSRLSLYSCVSLCRLHRRCAAIIYVEDRATMNKSEVATEDDEQDLFDALEKALTSARSAQATSDDGINELEEFGSPVGSSEESASLSGNPVCTLYEDVKLSRVGSCGLEPSSDNGKEFLTLLVLNPNVDFAEAARSMRITMALARARHKGALTDASRLTSNQTKQNHKASKKQRSNRLASNTLKMIENTSKAMHVLLEAVRVLEGAALQSVNALKAAKFARNSPSLLPLTSRLANEIEKSEPLSIIDLYSFHAIQPLGDECQVFAGVELLGNGCVQFPALQRISTVENVSRSDKKTSSKIETPEEVVPMTWQKCRGMLQKSQQLLAEYRKAVSEMKGQGAEAQDASKEAERLASLLMGLDLEQTLNLERMLRLSPSEIAKDMPKKKIVSSNEDEALLEEMKDLVSRKEVVERMGKEDGTIFAVFDTMQKVCEIRAVFEPRVAKDGGALGAQFPSACGLFQPSLLLLLPSVSGVSAGKDATGGTDAKGEDVSKNSQEEGVCPDVSCVYSTWTSWSPCDNHGEVVAAVDDNVANEDNKSGGVDATWKEHHASTRWQVRFKEALLHPKALPECEELVEMQLCENRGTAETEATQLMKGFNESISNNVWNHCRYGPFTAWSQCEPKCFPPDTKGITAYRRRTRSVHQYPVPGLAPSCEADMLVETEECPKVPQCQLEQSEGGMLETDTTDDISVEEPAMKTIAAAAIHLHSNSAAPKSEGEGIEINSPKNFIKSGLPAVPTSTMDHYTLPTRRNGFHKDGPSATDPKLFIEGTKEEPAEPHSVFYRIRKQRGLQPENPLSSEGFSSDQGRPFGNFESAYFYDTDRVRQTDGAGTASPVGSQTIPYDSPDLQGTEGGTADKTDASDSAADSDSEDLENLFLGLNLGSFVVCCLCGAFACATLVLLSVVSSKAIRSILGYDWSDGTDAERSALLDKKRGLAAFSAVSPLVDPNGVPVMSPQGGPLLVSPCMGKSRKQFLTSSGSKIFVTMEGDFVDEWGKPVQANELPVELKAEEVNKRVTDPAAPPSTVLLVPPAQSSITVSAPTLGPSTSNQKGASVLLKAKSGRLAPGSPVAKSPGPGFPTPKSPAGV